MEDDGEVGLGAGARYLLELRDHFFRRNRNICLRDEQLAVAERVGVDRAGLEGRLSGGSGLAGLRNPARVLHEIIEQLDVSAT